MEIYLPIAELAVPWIVPIAIGVVAGGLSGLFGVGGGFIMNPLLLMMGGPPGRGGLHRRAADRRGLGVRRPGAFSSTIEYRQAKE